jgi:ABC-type oligopeptide transport system ATPase subunit
MNPVALDGAILQVRGLKKSFTMRRGVLRRTSDIIRAVDDVNLDIAPRQTLGLVGESGCGKSTVARLILRLLDPDSGTIRFEGRDISGLNEKQFKPLRKEDPDDLPGPLQFTQPPHDRVPIHRRRRAHRRHHRQGAAAPAH